MNCLLKYCYDFCQGVSFFCKVYLLIITWLYLVFMATHALSLVVGAAPCCGARASPCSGFSYCGAQTLGRKGFSSCEMRAQ